MNVLGAVGKRFPTALRHIFPEMPENFRFPAVSFQNKGFNFLKGEGN